jgi:tetratricopeptide (TPR) repeat protein
MAKRTGKKAQQQIDVSGSGAAATGGGVAAGAGGVAIGGDLQGTVNIDNSVTNVYPQTEREIDALHQLPAPPADFTGREKQLAELQRKIQQGVTISGIRGMGGIGKTALALKLAEALAAQYPDAQFYLDLKGAAEQQPLSPAEAMRHVIQSIEPAAKLPDEPQQLAGLYHSLLAGKKALFLWDNARDAEQVRPLLVKGCLTLVTSRQTFSLPGMQRYDLETLGEQDASDLIRKIAEDVSPDEAGEIAKLCDYLPLAVRVSAGALAEQPDLQVSELVEGLTGTLASLGPVEASLRLSYDLLSDDLKRRFCQLAVFPAPFEREAAAAVWELEPKAAREALSELLKRSLLDYDKPGDRYDLHDLVRLFAAGRLAQDEALAKAALARHAEHYLQVGSKCEDEYKLGGEHIVPALERFRKVWPQLEAVWKRMDAGWGEGALRPEGAARWLADFPIACAYVLELDLPPRRSVAIFERAAQAAREIGDRWGEGAALGNLGNAYHALGELRKAIEFHEQQLEITRELGDRGGEGIALGNLGNAYYALGEARRAIELYEEQLVIVRETGDRRGEGAALTNLGAAHAGLGETRKAIEFYEQDLAIAREIGDRRMEGVVLGNLGIAYRKLGETRKAIEFYEQDLAIAREIGDRRGRGHALTNLGSAYIDLGEPRRAIEFYEQALTIAREIGDRQGEGNALGNLGSAYSILGEVPQAIEFYEQALEIDREIGDRWGEGGALGNLGLAYYVLGETRKAIRFHEQQLDITRETGDRGGEANALGSLGNAYADLGEARRAIEFCEQQLAITREIGDRRGEGAALLIVGNAVCGLGEQARGIALMREALQIFIEIESPFADAARTILEAWGEP